LQSGQGIAIVKLVLEIEMWQLLFKQVNDMFYKISKAVFLIQ